MAAPPALSGDRVRLDQRGFGRCALMPIQHRDDRTDDFEVASPVAISQQILATGSSWQSS